jgi:hypothetical protein
MSKGRPPYPPAFRQQMVELVSEDARQKSWIGRLRRPRLSLGRPWLNEPTRRLGRPPERLAAPLWPIRLVWVRLRDEELAP